MNKIPMDILIRNKCSSVLLTSLLLMMMAMPKIAIAENAQLVRVAIYDHSEEISNGPSNLLRFLIPEHGFSAQRVSPEQIQEGCLSDFDVLVMPGGSGSKQSEKLQESGRAQVKEFVRNGGGYVGICAGSYLASSHYSWSLGLINAKVWDREHWARGQGTVSLCLTNSGREVLGCKQKNVDVYYGQGPLLVPDNQSELPGYEVLATYGSEVAKKGAPVESMIDTHAVIRSMYGEGRVICFSPHPETQDGPNSLMASGIYWAAQVKP